jgi:phospholipase/carboxylesterase
MTPSLVNIGNVEALQVIGNDPSVGVIFLHGYGANMHDLFPLWEMWHQDKFNWYFPNGLLSLNMGYYEGRAWFSIDMAKLEEAMRTGKPRDMRGSMPVELDSTLHSLEHLVLELSKKHKTILLGGFSQGAMCASHLAMKSNLKVDGLILLSGALLAEAKMPKEAKGIPFYQSHGTKDPILNIEGAVELEEKLQSLNFQGKLVTFNGGHEIPPMVISGVKSFLQQFS